MIGPGEDITAEMEIREAIVRHPATRAIFSRHRLDACCGGAHSIATAALARGIDPDGLLAELKAAVTGKSSGEPQQ